MGGCKKSGIVGKYGTRCVGHCRITCCVLYLQRLEPLPLGSERDEGHLFLQTCRCTDTVRRVRLQLRRISAQAN